MKPNFLLFPVFAAFAAFGLMERTHAMDITRLRIEYRTNPLGLTETEPRLSWTLHSLRRGDHQTAYQLLCASSPALLDGDTGDLWDTRKTVSSETLHHVYGGRRLTSRQRVYWKVRVWDAGGKASKWSDPAFFEMGLLKPSDWQAQWIGGPLSPGGAAHNGYHSEFAKRADTPKWVSLDFGKKKKIDSVTLYPAQPFDTPNAEPGTFFPVRLKIEATDGTDFTTAHVIYETQTDLANPGLHPLTIPLPKQTSARQIKVTATRLRERKPGEFAFALAELQAASGGAPIPVLKPSSLDSIEYSSWSLQHLCDGDTTSHSGHTPPSPYLRRSFPIEKPFVSARLYVTARGIFDAYLNGVRVGDDYLAPGWTNYQKRIYVQTYDVTSLLKQGENAIGALLGDGWFSGHIGLTGRENYGKSPQFLAQLEITYGDGSRQEVVTDNLWRVTEGAIRASDLLMGETYDAREEEKLAGWNLPGYKADPKRWKKPAVVLARDEVKLEAYPAEGVRRVMEVKPKTVKALPNQTFLFDLGQNMVGYVRLKVKGKAGQTVKLRFAEILNPDGTLYTTNLRSAKCTDFYTLKGGEVESYVPHFTTHGFRYVEVTGYPGTPKLDAITGIVLSSVIEKVGEFVCSNPMVNQLQSNIEWGQRGNYLEIPTDCPQRDERLGWMGDAQIFARTACANFDVAAFLTKYLVDVTDAQSPNGGFPDVAPRKGATSDAAPAWGDAGVIVPYTLYLCYGDLRVLERNYKPMKRWVEYIHGGNPNLLWENHRNNDYGDWLSIKADTPKDVMATAYFAYSTSIVAKTAKLLGEDKDAARYEALFEEIRTAFQNAYVAPDGKIKGDTQTVYLLALRFNLLTEGQRIGAASHLTDNIVNRFGTHLSTGFVGVGYLNPTLTAIGRPDLAYKLLLNDTFPSWGYSIKQGATTIWERWDGWTVEKGFQDPGMNSFNHYSLGSVGEWLYTTVAGIDLDEAKPGYRHIVFKPLPGGGLSFAKGKINTLYGWVVSDWKLEGGKLLWTISVPVNTTATVYVPTVHREGIDEGGKPAERAGSGLKFLRTEAGFSVYEAGSGTYHFSITAPRTDF